MRTKRTYRRNYRFPFRVNPALLSFFIISLFLASCGEIVLRVNSLPSNTPTGDEIFLAGDFNYWNYADDRYRLKKGSDSAYYVVLPKGVGQVNVLFSRGNPAKAETDACGNLLSFRTLNVFGVDTLEWQIGAWADLPALDCDSITIYIDPLASGAKPGDELIIADISNTWTAAGNRYTTALDDSTGKLSITIPRPPEQAEWSLFLASESPSGEGNTFLKSVEPLSVSGDISSSRKQGMVIESDHARMHTVVVLKSFPPNVRETQDFFLAGDINGWNPGDPAFRFNSENGLGMPTLLIPRRGDYFYFKITRGNWESVETNAFGVDIDNRRASFMRDTVFVDIVGWKDLAGKAPDKLMVEVRTAPGADYPLYLAGDFNKWSAGDSRYRFTCIAPGVYSLELPGRFRHSAFKINRGSWDNQPCDPKGQEWPDKRFGDFPGGKVVMEVKNWTAEFWAQDPGTLFIIKELPPDTPENPSIYMSSSQAGWTLSDPNYRFTKNTEGRYELRLKRPSGTSMMEYKLNLGTWAKVETDLKGRDIDNRWHEYSLQDTVFIKVKGWKKH